MLSHQSFKTSLAKRLIVMLALLSASLASPIIEQRGLITVTTTVTITAIPPMISSAITGLLPVNSSLLPSTITTSAPGKHTTVSLGSSTKTLERPFNSSLNLLPKKTGQKTVSFASQSLTTTLAASAKISNIAPIIPSITKAPQEKISNIFTFPNITIVPKPVPSQTTWSNATTINSIGTPPVSQINTFIGNKSSNSSTRRNITASARKAFKKPAKTTTSGVVSTGGVNNLIDSLAGNKIMGCAIGIALGLLI